MVVADVEADTPQHHVYLIGDDRPLVLGRADQLVEQRGDIVTLLCLLMRPCHTGL